MTSETGSNLPLNITIRDNFIIFSKHYHSQSNTYSHILPKKKEHSSTIMSLPPSTRRSLIMPAFIGNECIWKPQACSSNHNESVQDTQLQSRHGLEVEDVRKSLE